MKYVVIEMQNGIVGSNVWVYDDINQAESKYHLTLSSAAISQIEVHTAVLMNETGFLVHSYSFEHRQPEEEEHDLPEEEVSE